MLNLKPVPQNNVSISYILDDVTNNYSLQDIAMLGLGFGIFPTLATIYSTVKSGSILYGLYKTNNYADYVNKKWGF